MNNNKSVQSFKGEPDYHLNEKTHYIPVEINLSQLPFFASDTKGLAGKVTDFKDEVRLSDGSVVPLHWQVSGNTVYGYPSPFAERVFYAIIEVAFESGYPVQNPVALNMSDICRRLGLQRFDSKKNRFVIDSRDRKRVKKAIRSIKAALIVCKGAFRVDGELKSLDDDGVHLFERTAFIGEQRNAETGEKWTHTAVWLSDFLLKSINARFLRPIDRMVIERLSARALSSPKIYNYLSYEFAKRVFAKGRTAKYVDVPYKKIAVIADITLKSSVKHAKRSFELAHKALIEEDIVDQFKWIGAGSSSEDYKIRYWPGARARREYKEGPKALQRTYQLTLFPKAKDTPTDSALFKKLQDLGFDSGSAQAVMRQYKYSKIETHLNYLIHNLETGKPIANPAGWVRKSLEGNWRAPSGFVDPTVLKDRKALQLRRAQELAKIAEDKATAEAVEEGRRRELLTWFKDQPNADDIRQKILEKMINEADTFNASRMRNLDKPIEDSVMDVHVFCKHLESYR